MLSLLLAAKYFVLYFRRIKSLKILKTFKCRFGSVQYIQGVSKMRVVTVPRSRAC
jgi:hypothetical protein